MNYIFLLVVLLKMLCGMMMMMGVLPKGGPDDLLFLTYHRSLGRDMSKGGFSEPSSADNGT